MSDKRSIGRRHAGPRVGFQCGGICRIIDQHTPSIDRINRTQLQVGFVACLPLDNTERVKPGRGGIHRPGALTMLAACERLHRSAIIFTNFETKKIMRIRSNTDLITIVIVDVSPVGTHIYRKGSYPSGQLNIADGFHGKIRQAAVLPRDSWKSCGIKSCQPVIILIQLVKWIPIQFKINGVHSAGSIRIRSSDSFIRNCGTRRIGECPIQLI